MARKVTPRTIELAERRRQALILRSQRRTYEAIAKALKYSDKTAAWRDIQKGIEELTKEPAEAVRQLELELLDSMARGLTARAIKGDDKAIQSMLRIMERRSKYIGLDAPTQIETGGPGEFTIIVDPNVLPTGVNLNGTGD